MNEANQKNIEMEASKYVPYKTYVQIWKIKRSEKDGSKIRSKWYEGLVSAVTTRGIMVNACNENPHAESLDTLTGQFVPYSIFVPEVEITIIKRHTSY